MARRPAEGRVTARRTLDARLVRCDGKVTTRTLPSGELRWLFKWTAGSARTRSFRTETEAAQFRLDLRRAKEFGADNPFDAETGVPVRMLATETPAPPVEEAVTVQDLGADVIARAWGRWSPGNRRTRSESMALVLAELLTERPPAKIRRAHLVRALRDQLLPPDGSRMPVDGPVQAAADWLPGHSLPVSELTLRGVERALTAAGEKVTVPGVLYASDMLGHQRTSLSLLCKQAMRDGLLDVNLAQAAEPVRASKTSSVAVEDVEEDDDDDSKVVDPRRVASPAQCRALIARAGKYSSTSWRYVAYWTLLWLTGMRPSEATGLRLRTGDLYLPESGWGWANVRKPVVATGQRWTGTGSAHATRSTTKTNKPRRVKLHPEAVAALRAHIELAKVKPGQLLFTNSKGTPVDPSAMGKVWRALREREFGDDPTHPLAALRVYDMRHTAGSLLIKAVGIVAAAEQLGHSPVTLMRTYAKCMETDDEAFEASVEAVFG
jgi:integrase